MPICEVIMHFQRAKKHAKNCMENIIKQVIKASDNSNNDNVVITFLPKVRKRYTLIR